MKSKIFLIVSTIVVLLLMPFLVTFCTLPLKQIELPSIVFRIVDEQTDLPVEGIRIHTDSNYIRPKSFFWVLALPDGQIGKTHFSMDFVSDKNGMVTIPKRIKTSSRYGHIHEHFWVNLTGFIKEKGYTYERYSEDNCSNNINELYGGIYLSRHDVGRLQSEPWKMNKSALYRPQALEPRATTADAPVIVLKLRPKEPKESQ